MGHRFLTAFMAYELRPEDRGARAVLAATAASSLARDLLRSPPRPVNGLSPDPAQLVALRAGDDATRAAVSLLATVRRGQRMSGLVLVVERRDARWLVAHLGS